MQNQIFIIFIKKSLKKWNLNTKSNTNIKYIYEKFDQIRLD